MSPKSAQKQLAPQEHGSQDAIGRVRWGICALLFFATTINYIDRQVIALLKPILQERFHWNENDYGNIVVAFQGAYAVGLLIVGGVIDRIGVKLGYLLAVLLWSAAAAAHGLANRIPDNAHLTLAGMAIDFTALSVVAFGAARAALGLAEAANFPAAIKAVGEWFPKRERAYATGVFNSGANIGAMTAPFVLPWIAVRFGWPVAFYITGALGLIWAVVWAMQYQRPQDHPRLSTGELNFIRADLEEQGQSRKIPWLSLLGRRQTIAFSIVKFFTDPIWWFYLFWIPSFLEQRHGIKVTQVGLPLFVIYMTTTLGSVAGGWLSSAMIARGFSVNVSRKTAMLVCALCVVPIFAATVVTHLWAAVLLVALAAAAHQGFSCNIFTVASDITPKDAVSSVVGIGGMFGAVGGMFFAKFVGYILDHTQRNYFIPFAICSSAYLVSLLFLHLLLPRLQPMEFNQTS